MNYGQIDLGIPGAIMDVVLKKTSEEDGVLSFEATFKHYGWNLLAEHAVCRKLKDLILVEFIDPAGLDGNFRGPDVVLKKMGEPAEFSFTVEFDVFEGITPDQASGFDQERVEEQQPQAHRSPVWQVAGVIAYAVFMWIVSLVFDYLGNAQASHIVTGLMLPALFVLGGVLYLWGRHVPSLLVTAAGMVCVWIYFAC